MSGPSGANPQRGGHRLVPLLAMLAALAALLLVPFQIVGYGYMPTDDALRHAAKAISGRPWQDILVLRPGMTMDIHPGWHGLLGFVSHRAGFNVDSLVVFSVVSVVLVFLLTPLLFSVRVEAWVAAVGICILASGDGWERLFFGRPLVLTMTAIVVFCLLAKKLAARQNHWVAMAATAVAVAVSVWLNGTWYLWAMPVVAMLLARQWQGAVRTAGVMAVGVLAGACLTGQPIAFLWSGIKVLLITMNSSHTTTELVGELQPMIGVPMAFVAAMVLIWRQARRRQVAVVLSNPAFLLAAFSWFLGIFVGRFLMDWAYPAFAAWLTLELLPPIVRHIPRQSLSRLGLVAALSVTVFALFTRDVGGRWSKPPRVAHLSTVDSTDPSKPTPYADWMPEPGGILYSDSMDLFYGTFYANPYAPWRYMLGFEPGLMPDEDLKTFRHIQESGGADDSYQPWVKKMRPQDRLVLDGRNGHPPNIPDLDWRYAVSNLWIGRLPRPAASPTPPAKSPPVAP